MSESGVPAIAGGTPAKQTPFGRETRYGEEELRELSEALAQGTLFYASGKKVRRLEEAFAAKNGIEFAVACASGTAAIHSALIALGISPGDEVILAPITDMGSAIPILYQGAVPVFADLNPNTYCLSPESVEAVLTPRTKAVLAIHLWGNSCDMDALMDICMSHSITLIEDCAQALGCTYKERPIGTIGEVGCFSLNEFKHISCGDGGIVLTRDYNLANRLRLATDKSYDRTPGAKMRNPAFLANNYRLTELQGAVAVAQLDKLDGIVARRREWCGALSRRLRDIPGISLPMPTPGCEPSWWFYMMKVNSETLGADADAFAEALRAEGLPTSAHYIGACLYDYPVFASHSAFKRGKHPYMEREYRHGLCPNAEEILANCVILAINEAYTDVDLEETVRAIRKVAHWMQS